MECSEKDVDATARLGPGSTDMTSRTDPEKPSTKGKEEKIETQDCSRWKVTWDGPHDPKNPLNWSALRKWSVTVLVSLGGFITYMSGSMIAPALADISHDLNVDEATAGLMLSVFLLAFAFGPLLLAPFSEVFGRKPVWLAAGVFYSVWSIVGGFSPNAGTLVAARLLSGIGASVDFVVSWPVIGDIWSPEERGKSIAIVMCLPVLGPALGPLVGGVITQTIGWPWIFWWAAIFNGTLVVLAFFVFPETSSARILAVKASKLRKDTGQPYHSSAHHGSVPSLGQRILTSIKRPTLLLFTSPIMQVLSVLWAYSFGILYFVLSTYANLFTGVYRQTTLQSGLHYISIAVGYLIAQQVGGVVMDALWARLKTKRGDSTAPEYRSPLLVPGGVLATSGLLWLGWSVEAKLHWIMPDIGAAIFACGFMLNLSALGAYTLDAFPDCTASAVAASQFYKMIAAFGFPIFAPAMYARLGWGWTNTTMALIALVFGLPAPFVLWKYGARIRAAGRQPT